MIKNGKRKGEITVVSINLTEEEKKRTRFEPAGRPVVAPRLIDDVS